MIPTGRQLSIQHGDLAAVVTELGASLRELTWRGRPLVVGFGRDELPIGYQGAVLAPWPNRIADGRYEFAGQPRQLDLTEPDRLNALHGLVIWSPWRVDTLDRASVRLSHRLWPHPGYPFVLDLEVGYRLGDNGLTFTLAATNAGDAAAPYGGSFHPYLVAADGDVDSWTVQSPAASYLTVDPDRLLPRDVVPVRRGRDERAFDFRAPTSLRGVEVDHAFTDIAFTDDDSAELTLFDRGGQGVRMSWDRRCPWLQLCIPGAQRPQLHRKALAVEPMTCPPDAFNSGVDLVVLQPGQSHSLELTIGAIG
jgi:aldose 1-epimerase